MRSPVGNRPAGSFADPRRGGLQALEEKPAFYQQWGAGAMDSEEQWYQYHKELYHILMCLSRHSFQPGAENASGRPLDRFIHCGQKSCTRNTTAPFRQCHWRKGWASVSPRSTAFFKSIWE